MERRIAAIVSSDEALLRRVAQWVVPRMDLDSGGFWIIDDMGYPKKGRHSVGVARPQLEALLAQGAPHHCVIADAGYGVEAQFRLRLTEMGLPYMVGIKSSVSVWPPEVESLLPKRCP